MKDTAMNAGKDTTAATILTEGMITTPAGAITDTTIIAEDINNKIDETCFRAVFFVFIAI